MDRLLFNEFLASDDTLRVYHDKRRLFSSKKDGLLPLLEYLEQPDGHHPPVTIFDKVMGNAAALLSVQANGQEVYSPLGSRLAVETLEKHGLKYHLNEIVPCILKPSGDEMCPMEKLSTGKEPEEFYKLVSRTNKPKKGATWKK